MLGPEYEEIAKFIPNDHARPTEVEELLAKVAGGLSGIAVLDLGCGDGRGVEVVRAVVADADYTGVDIESSPEVNSRTGDDARFQSYDGRNLPFADCSFDVVYSRQVLEHVRHPDYVAAEVLRVLKPGGRFVASLSNLEPYHSFSIFNFTPYGVFRLLDDNGFALKEMRPGVEGMALIVRQLSMRRLQRVGVAYPAIELAGMLRGWDARRRNYLKLRFAGHIAFIAERPAER